MKYTPETLQAAGISPKGLKFCGAFPPYDPKLTEVARELRNNSTISEIYLWVVLKKCKNKYKFTRQKPVLHYIADFYCNELSLVVEIDGVSHDGHGAQAYDRKRDKDMRALGLTVVRLVDNDVKKNPFAAAQQIFVSAGVPMPEQLDFLATGQEKLFPEGYLRRSR